MKRISVWLALSGLLIGGVVYAEYVTQTPVINWFKQGFYVGKSSASPTSSAGNKETGSFGTSSVIDVASVTGGTCVDTAVVLADAGTTVLTGAAVGDPCFVGTPASPAANASFTCFVPAANALKLRACAGTTVDPASGTYFFRVVSSQ